MLLTYFYTGAQRGEVFRLTWDDVCFETRKIRLVDHKGRGGAQRSRWVPMHDELANKALSWWRDERPCAVDNVFMGSTPKTGAIPFNGQFFRQVSERFPSHFSSTKRAHAGGSFRSCESHTHAAGSTSFFGESLL